MPCLANGQKRMVEFTAESGHSGAIKTAKVILMNSSF
jgi:hypothetical protein